VEWYVIIYLHGDEDNWHIQGRNGRTNNIPRRKAITGIIALGKLLGFRDVIIVDTSCFNGDLIDPGRLILKDVHARELYELTRETKSYVKDYVEKAIKKHEFPICNHSIETDNISISFTDNDGSGYFNAVHDSKCGYRYLTPAHIFFYVMYEYEGGWSKGDLGIGPMCIRCLLGLGMRLYNLLCVTPAITIHAKQEVDKWNEHITSAIEMMRMRRPLTPKQCISMLKHYQSQKMDSGLEKLRSLKKEGTIHVDNCYHVPVHFPSKRVANYPIGLPLADIEITCPIGCCIKPLIRW